jgi:hypothetical protein
MICRSYTQAQQCHLSSMCVSEQQASYYMHSWDNFYVQKLAI